MPQTTQTKNWKRKAMRKAEVISDAFEVFKAWLAHFANWILFFCLIGNILQTVVNLGSVIAGTLLCIQCVVLDIAGASLYTMAQHAKSQGNDKGAKLALVMSIILLLIMTITALNSTLNIIFPGLSSIVQDVNYALIFARIVIVVAYGNVVHQLNTLSEMHDNRIAELEEALNAKSAELDALTLQLNTQVNALTTQFNTRVDTLTGELNTKNAELDTLRVKVNALTLQLDTLTQENETLSVKLDGKEAQLTEMRNNRESSMKEHRETTELAVSTVKAKLLEADQTREALRHQLDRSQEALHSEQQKALTLTAEVDTLTVQLNTKVNTLTGELNTKNAELNTLRVKVNALTSQLNAKDTERNDESVNPAKIVHLDQTQDSTYESRIRALLVGEPGLSGREIARRIGCSIPTACNWKRTIEKAESTEQVV